ncbi:MAG: hypothetical protein K1V87_00640 [Muribaculum sp.]
METLDFYALYLEQSPERPFKVEESLLISLSQEIKELNAECARREAGSIESAAKTIINL